MNSHLEVTHVKGGGDGETGTTLTVHGRPVRLTFPDGGTIDLAVGQEFTVWNVQTKPRGTTNCGVERKLKPKTTGWEWVREAMRRGDEAAERRLAEAPELIDCDGDLWVRDHRGYYWMGDIGNGEAYSFAELSEFSPLTTASGR